MRLVRVVAVAGFGAALPLVAQAQKRALTQADWDTWRSISAPALCNDGHWAVYTLVPQVGDGDLVIRSTQGSAEYRVPRGYVGRPNNVPGGLRPRSATGESDPPAGSVAPAVCAADSKHVLALTYLPQADFERLGRGGRGGRGAAAAQNRSNLAIVSTADGKVTTIPAVRSFRLPRASGAWVAYVPADTTRGDSTARAGRGGSGGGGATASGTPRRSFGTTLVLRSLETGAEDRIADVLAYAFDDSAKTLAYTVVSHDSTKDGVFARSLRTAAVTSLMTGPGDYKQVTFDRGGTQLAFVSNRDDKGASKPLYTLYYAMVRAAAARAAVSPAVLRAGTHLADNAPLAFTRSGNAVLFGIAPSIPDSVTADSLVDKAVFDLWHYKDPTLQPAQKLTAARDRTRSFQSIWYPSTGKFVQLATDSMPAVSVSDDGRVALANSDERYLISAMWGDDGTDVWVIDGTSGARKLVREKSSGNGQLSPDGKYVAFFDRGHWYAYSTASGKTVDLTGGVAAVSFEEETWDTPSTPEPWGIAGWTKGDRSLLVYDRYDVWELDPTGGKAPVVVTDSVGRREHVVLRLAEANARGRFSRGASDDRGVIDPAKPLLLSAFNDDTKASGFYRDQLGVTRAPEKLVLADVAYGTPVKAADADEWMVTRGTFVEFPNLWVGPSITELTKISDANPQQKEYNWGSVELVHWASSDGVPLKGLLYKPENFDPTRKYPMIAYFYEQLSNNLHQYVPPTGRNVINPTHYVSNGYLVFEPDIHYETGHPGPSAMKSIVPGVQMLLERGYVDPKRLGIQGQSWGGYQTAYIITQTHMFAAAMAGAPVVDMFSAYGGIRWGSGLARAFQYEKSQSRIGKSIWDAPNLYVENSPLFWLPNVTTPLFIMANDMDDAVPWYQGIEFFVAMRRLGKEVYMISYNNDVHNPASRANQKDIAMRMQQFFDNKLKGALAPDWMIHGIPYIAKGRDQLGASTETPVQAGSEKPR